jgi:hypothetical protein
MRGAWHCRWIPTRLSGEIFSLAPYGRTRFVSVPQRRAYRIVGRETCERRLAELRPG